MNRVILAGAIIGVLAVMLVTSTVPVYSNHEVQKCNGLDATVWVVDSEGNGFITVDNSLVQIKFKKNKNTDGFIISGDMDRNNKADVIVGSDGPDKISGGKGIDVICGEDGNDKISGGSGDDILYGNDGEDTILGGSNDDTLCDGDDNKDAEDDSCVNDSDKDILDGGRGDDTITGLGEDMANGGRGDDTCTGISEPISC